MRQRHEVHGNEETSELEALIDDEFEDRESYLDFNIFDPISDFCSKPQKSSIGYEPDGNQNLASVPAELLGSFNLIFTAVLRMRYSKR